MNRLVINTANSDLVVLVANKGKISYKCESNVLKHNETILNIIKDALFENKLTLKDIDEYGVVVGPGSFTGVRVGIATIKGFKDVYNKPAKGINNLSLLFSTAKGEYDYVAIEGSLNSYFVGEKFNNKLYIYPRNLSENELFELANGKKVACYHITDNMKNTKISFEEIEPDWSILDLECQKSNDTSLVPVYYQLSQAENEKINRGKIAICEMQENHIEDVSSLDSKIFINEEIGDGVWTKDTYNTIIKDKNQIGYVAMLENEIIGYAVTEVSDEINVSRIAVCDTYRNHGVASMIIAYIENIAKQSNKKVSLEVCEDNVTAYKLYLKLGYKLRRERKNYYKNNKTCYELVK